MKIINKNNYQEWASFVPQLTVIADVVDRIPFHYYNLDANYLIKLEIIPEAEGYSITSLRGPANYDDQEIERLTLSYENSKELTDLLDGVHKNLIVDLKTFQAIYDLENKERLGDKWIFWPAKRIKRCFVTDKDDDPCIIFTESGLHSASEVLFTMNRLIKSKPTRDGIYFITKLMEGYYGFDPISDWIIKSIEPDPVGEPKYPGIVDELQRITTKKINSIANKTIEIQTQDAITLMDLLTMSEKVLNIYKEKSKNRKIPVEMEYPIDKVTKIEIVNGEVVFTVDANAGEINPKLAPYNDFPIDLIICTGS